MTSVFSMPADDIKALPIYQSILEKSSVDIYLDSPFLPLKLLSSKTKGAKFEQVLHEHLVLNHYDVAKAGNYDWDRTVNGHKVEIKGSFLWEGGTHFRWQQIRINQEYDYVVFLAFYPSCLEIYAADKEAVIAEVTKKDENGYWIWNQHGGKKVKEADTFYLDGMPEDFPWMKPLYKIIPPNVALF